MTWLDEVRDKARVWNEAEIVRRDKALKSDFWHQVRAVREKKKVPVECGLLIPMSGTISAKKCGLKDGHEGRCQAKYRGRINEPIECTLTGWCVRLDGHEDNCRLDTVSVFPIITDYDDEPIPDATLPKSITWKREYPPMGCDHAKPGLGPCKLPIGHGGEHQYFDRPKKRRS